METSIQTFRIDSATAAAIIKQTEPEILELWLALLRSHWAAEAERKIGTLLMRRATGGDLLSFVLGLLRRDAEPGEAEVRPIIRDVRRLDYSIVDLFLEISTLLQALETVLGEAATLPFGEAGRVVHRVRCDLNAIFLRVLSDTSAIYESSAEGGGRGYCQLDGDGVITFANGEMHRLLGVEDAVGMPLAPFFGTQATYVLGVIRGDHGSAPAIRHLELRRRDGTTIPVNAGIAPVIVNGRHCGVYAQFSDLSTIIRAETAIFERSPLGILKTNEHQEITYANKEIRKIFGIGNEPLEGRSLWDFVTDPDNQAVIREKLRLRYEGLSDEYPLEYYRARDGERLRIMIAAMPELDTQGQVIGALAIVRSLEAEKIHEAVETYRDPNDLLAAIAPVICREIPYDLLMVSTFSRCPEDDIEHARVLFSHGSAAVQRETGWYPISKPLAAWLKQPGPRAVPDFRGFLEAEEAAELRDSRDSQEFVKAGFEAFLVYAIIRDDQVAATLTLMSKTPSAYGPEHEDVLRRLPVDKAILMALYHCERREEAFRAALLRKIASVQDVDAVATTIVEELARHYRWQNVAIFMADLDCRKLRIKAQKEGPDKGFLLPAEYSLNLDEGVLGHVYRTGKAANLGDVRGSSPLARVYKPSGERTNSELCLPIQICGQIRWLLNVEATEKNAFSEGEVVALQMILQEIEVFLGHVFTYYTFDQVFKSSSDFIVITDLEGSIIDLNAAAEHAFGISRSAVQGQPFAAFFTDRTLAAFASDAKLISPLEVSLRAPESGNTVNVLLSGRLLPEEFGRKVFFCKDLSVKKRLEELEAIGGMFHEIAVQTRTPLSLLSSWLRRLRQKVPAMVRDVLDKALQQLRKVEISYDRLLLYDADQGVIPYSETRIDLGQVIEGILDLMPEAERRFIRYDPPKHLPPLSGDAYQISFVIESILSYLLRFAPEEDTIDLSVAAEDGMVRIAIAGPLPAGAPATGGPAETQSLLQRSRAEISLGESVIRRFVQRHHGTYSQHWRDDQLTRFDIALPVQRPGPSPT